ncbi:MAG: ATP-binding protein [Dechloromonas sp.]|nr:ATP-binding protein [Dechloromonas sp.]
MRKKPETLALSVALIGTLSVLLVFFIDLALSRARDLENGEHRLQHFGIMMAEHTARTFEALDVLLREMATDLAGNRRDWEKWEPNKGWEYVAQRHSRAMPQLRDLIIFDRNGDQRFISTYFPAPQINVADRPYFQALAKGAETASFGPYIGRNSGRYTYAIARRISGPDGRFAGATFAAIEPAYLQDFCWSNRLSDDFEAVLINERGQVIASCRPADLSRQSPLLGKPAEELLFGGRLRDRIPAGGVASHRGLLISVSPVSGFPDLRILTAIPEASVLANWRSRLVELGTLGSLVALVLLVGALLIRRQVRDMAAITAELAASRDTLEQRVAEATHELAGRKDAAERANRAKSRFLAAASHDLRQPMHALSLFATDLQRQVGSGNLRDLPRLAEQISTSSALLGEMLDALLDVSRLDVSGIKPEIRACPLQPLFERLDGSCRRDAVDREQRLRFHPTRLWVESDPVMLERMIANLVSNAMRYTPPGGRILVAARRRDGRVVVEVRDSGIGIAPEHQSAIFAEFYQVGNAAREQGKGLGLGLSIVDRLAKALQIEIGLRSRVGEGTTFMLSLPAAQPQETIETVGTAERLHVVGDSEALLACIELAAHWGYAISQDDGLPPLAPPPGVLVIADADRAAALAERMPADSPLIVLGSNAPPAGAHALSLPVRPARLRALVNQLQKTLPKSMP